MQKAPIPMISGIINHGRFDQLKRNEYNTVFNAIILIVQLSRTLITSLAMILWPAAEGCTPSPVQISGAVSTDRL